MPRFFQSCRIHHFLWQIHGQSCILPSHCRALPLQQIFLETWMGTSHYDGAAILAFLCELAEDKINLPRPLQCQCLHCTVPQCFPMDPQSVDIRESLKLVYISRGNKIEILIAFFARYCCSFCTTQRTCVTWRMLRMQATLSPQKSHYWNSVMFYNVFCNTLLYILYYMNPTEHSPN